MDSKENTGLKGCIYGPVPSRRLGLSLGIDLVPHKVCCYDCLYCQIGRTNTLSLERKTYRPVEAVVQELTQALQERRRPEIITLAGYGDPTLYQPLGALIQRLRQASQLPVALLTNGALLHDPVVASEAAQADVVAPSLDAGDAETFQRINQPHPALDFATMVRGLQRFRTLFSGRLWLEVMLVRGINDSPASLEALCATLETIDADRIDINTVVRPAPHRNVHAVSEETLQKACDLFGPRAQLIASAPKQHANEVVPDDLVDPARLLETLARRPCTLADLHLSTGLPEDKLEETLCNLLAQKKIEPWRESSESPVYYRILGEGGGRTI